MNKWAWLFVLMLVLDGGGVRQSIHAVPTIESDVIWGNTLPDWGVVCKPAMVRGGPNEMYTPLYSVAVGKRVRLHDQSQPNGDWVSIKAARWIPVDSVCWSNE